MNDREIIKLLAFGQYSFTRMKTSIDVKEMEVFVEAALWHHDFINKKQTDLKYLNAMHLGNQIQEAVEHMPVDISEMV